MARLPRIEALLGAPLDELTEANIRSLLVGAVREDTDLDFKVGLYGNADADKRDLAGDVAAMANTIGGALILGIEEVDAVATSANPVALSDAEELRIRQIVAANVSPYVAFAIHRTPLDNDPNSGFYVLEVPRSTSAPHAVAVNKAFRYPKRDGASVRWLAEAEVADAYRSRFAGAREQIERVAAVRREGEAALPVPNDHAWLSVAIVPNLAGEMSISRVRVEEMQNFPREVDFPSFTDSPLHGAAPYATAGHRRIVLNLGQHPDGTAYGGVVHLHQDGSAFVSTRVGREAAENGVGRGFLFINDEWLTQEVISCVAVGTAHAIRNCGAAGDAVVEATLVSNLPMTLHHGRSGFDDTWNAHPVQGVPVGRHTIVLDEVAAAAPGLVATAHLVISDILQGFGVPESPQLTATGGVRIQFFRHEHQQRVRQEAARGGLEVREP